MFAALGRSVYRFRRLVVIVSIAVAALLSTIAIDVTGRLSTGGWIDSDSESAVVGERLASGFASGSAQVYIVYAGGPDADARSDAFQSRIGESLAPLLEDPIVVRATGYAELPDDRFISLDGSGAFVIVDLTVVTRDAIDDVERLRALVAPIDGVDISMTGLAPITSDAARVSEQDLVRAEAISLPITLLILVTVFASLVAAGMPLLVAGLAIPTTLGLVAALAQLMEMSVFVLNVASMLGLALAIDYSLFMVSRFREELALGRSTAEAVERSVATAGEAVVFSALAVAIGLSGLMLFEADALSSMGVAGVLVVIASMVYAITFLPAALGMLGPRVNALSVSGLYRRLGWRGPVPGEHVAGRPSQRWVRLANGVMAHPVRVLIPTTALLLILGLPFLQVRQAVPDATLYPAGMESRDAFVALREDFSPGETSPLVVLADMPAEPTSAQGLATLERYAAGLRAIEGVARVDSFFTAVPNPLTGDPLTTAQLAVAFEEAALRELLQPLLDRYVRGTTVRLDVISPYLTSAPEAPGLVAAVRSLDAGDGARAMVGGAHASGVDLMTSIEGRLPFVVISVVFGMLASLWLLFGSVILPIKAVIMTSLSIVASFGALVWVFQQGNLQDLLGFEAPGFTITGLPIAMFAVLFGLSMDYEVLLLTRISESYRRTGDNTRAVADGLARTAGVISGAASIMVVVFAAFALADVITIKALGLGMAIAIFLDATIVRMFLVPATMRLMGDWNWWAPGFLRRARAWSRSGHEEAGGGSGRG